jgi:hypothetical protein
MSGGKCMAAGRLKIWFRRDWLGGHKVQMVAATGGRRGHELNGRCLVDDYACLGRHSHQIDLHADRQAGALAQAGGIDADAPSGIAPADAGEAAASRIDLHVVDLRRVQIETSRVADRRFVVCRNRLVPVYFDGARGGSDCRIPPARRRRF